MANDSRNVKLATTILYSKSASGISVLLKTYAKCGKIKIKIKWYNGLYMYHDGKANENS